MLHLLTNNVRVDNCDNLGTDKKKISVTLSSIFFMMTIQRLPEVPISRCQERIQEFIFYQRGVGGAASGGGAVGGPRDFRKRYS
jgi:hypothetical protein